jgi:hypothetical protein
VLTREQRLAVIREFWSFNYVQGGYPDGYTAIDAYERVVKERA